MDKPALKHLLNLPDGNALKITHPYAKGPQHLWYKSHDKPEVWAASDKPKGRNWRTNLWSAPGDLCVVAADFDNLPGEFCDYDSLYTYLKQVFPDTDAIVARSASMKVKAFFLVQTPPGVDMSKAIAIDTLEKIFSFNEVLVQSLDLGTNGLRITYLNRSVLEALSKGLCSLVPVLSSVPLGWGERGVGINTSTTPTSLEPSIPAKPYRSYAGDLTELMPELRAMGKAKESLLRILLEAPQLLSPEGFCISTSKAAKDIGVSQQLISRCRHDFEKCGWLIEVNGRVFKKGQRAIAFVAAGALAEAIRKLHPPKTHKKLVIPKSIPDGQWYKQLNPLMRSLQYLYTEEEAMRIVRGIEGSHIGTRMKEARNWYRSHRRYSKTKKSLDGVQNDRMPNQI